MVRARLSLALFVAIAGCGLVSPEAKVRARLIAAGIGPHMADCLAPKLVAKLSHDELEALGRLATVPHREVGYRHRHSLGRLEDKLAVVDDPQIVDVVTRAALGCAILG